MKYNEKNSVLNTDSWDYHTFGNIYSSSDKFQKNINDFSKKDEQKYGLIGDVFSSLYKHTPMLKSEFEKLHAKAQTLSESAAENEDILAQLMKEHGIATMTPEKPANPNELMMQKLLENDQYLKMHDASMGDKLHSTISTMALGDEINSWYEEQNTNEDFKDAQNELQDAQKQLQKVNDAIQKREEDGKEPTKQQQDKKQKAQEKLEQANQNAMQQMEKSLPSDKLSEMVAKAKEQAENTKEGTKELLGGASDGEAELKKLPLNSQIAIADLLRNNNSVKRIAEMAGRFKAIARKKQKNKHIETIERNGLTLGNDVDRLIAQELALYKNAGTKLEFLRRFSEQQTMQYSPKGKEVLGKGAMVVVLDESSSMSNLNEQSKGFVIALAMIAKKQRRDLVVIPFSNRVGEMIVCEKGTVLPEHIITMATKFLAGGTHYVPALEKAKEVIENQKRFKNGDILFVTDGDPYDKGAINKFIEEFVKFKNKTGCNVISLLIGNEVSETYVSKFSDKVILSDDFLSDATSEILSI